MSRKRLCLAVQYALIRERGEICRISAVGTQKAVERVMSGIKLSTLSPQSYFVFLYVAWYFQRDDHGLWLIKVRIRK